MAVINAVKSLRLPPHWHVRTDEDGNDFYWNSHTFKKSFTKPTPLPLGWREQRNLETGEVYIYNVLTRKTQLAPAELQVYRPPPEPLGPPPPTMEMYSESIRSRRQTMPVASEPESRRSRAWSRARSRAASMGDPKVPPLHTPRAAARAGVPVTVDPFSLSTRWRGAQFGSDADADAEVAAPGPPPGAVPPGPPPGPPPWVESPAAHTGAVPAVVQPEPTTKESAAAASIQAGCRGRLGRKSVDDLRDEKARLQWVDHYVSRRMFKQARELGWEPQSEEEAQAEAATTLQAAARGKTPRSLGSSSDDPPESAAAAPDAAAPATRATPPAEAQRLEGRGSSAKSFKNLFGLLGD